MNDKSYHIRDKKLWCEEAAVETNDSGMYNLLEKIYSM